VSRRTGLLTTEQRDSLERDGYLLVPSLLDERVLAPMRARLDELVYQTLLAWDADPGPRVSRRAVSIHCWRKLRPRCLARTGT
jgi:hypothetical protein